MGLGKQIKAKRNLKARTAEGRMAAMTDQDISYLNTGQKIRMGRKLDRALMQDAKRDLKGTAKASKDIDATKRLAGKLETKAAKEKIRQSYSQTAHNKIDRIADNLHHIQDEMGQSKIRKASINNAKSRMEGYDSTADKTRRKRNFKKDVQAEKGKHRFLRKKVDINVDSHDRTDVDIYRRRRNIGTIGRKHAEKSTLRPLREIKDIKRKP